MLWKLLKTKPLFNHPGKIRVKASDSYSSPQTLQVREQVGEAEHEMCCYANNTYLSPGMKWAGSGIASLYIRTHALNPYEPREEEERKEGIKFSHTFLDRTVIYLCSVEACLYVSAPVGRDDHWPLAGARCGLPQKPRTTESIFCRIRMKNIFELLQLSGYRSKNRLGELLLSVSSFFYIFITLHMKDNRREKQMSESDKQ